MSGGKLTYKSTSSSAGPAILTNQELSAALDRIAQGPKVSFQSEGVQIARIAPGKTAAEAVCLRCGKWLYGHASGLQGWQCLDRQPVTSARPYPWLLNAPDIIDKHARVAVEGKQIDA